MKNVIVPGRKHLINALIITAAAVAAVQSLGSV